MSAGVAGLDSVCTISVGGQRFGIETAALAQVVLSHGMRRVPLGPAFCCGVLAYRGEVLTVVGMRRLLHMDDPAADTGCVLVIDSDGERFGLLVDEVGAVMEAAKEDPTPGNARSRLFEGGWRWNGELLLRVNPVHLTPGRLCGQGDAIEGREAA